MAISLVWITVSPLLLSAISADSLPLMTEFGSNLTNLLSIPEVRQTFGPYNMLEKNGHLFAVAPFKSSTLEDNGALFSALWISSSYEPQMQGGQNELLCSYYCKLMSFEVSCCSFCVQVMAVYYGSNIR